MALGKPTCSYSRSQEIERHINDKEAYMAPLETRLKIMSSLLASTPNERKIKGKLKRNLGQFGTDKDTCKMSKNFRKFSWEIWAF